MYGKSLNLHITFTEPQITNADHFLFLLLMHIMASWLDDETPESTEGTVSYFRLKVFGIPTCNLFAWNMKSSSV
jgi:hypothetical protein